MLKTYLLRGLVVVLVVLAIVFITEILIIRFNGSPVLVPEIQRQVTYGSGEQLTYVVMGDSTAISQGSDYDDGFAVATAKHLARTRQVRLINTGVSGATARKVLMDQLSEAVRNKPDVVLLSVGANDATHFTRGSTLRTALQAIVDGLRKSNPEVRIVFTGSPAMSSADRFPVGAKWLMRMRTDQLNVVFMELASQNNLVFAPVSAGTREAFLTDPTLLASDKFHPNARGYALWTPIITKALDTALEVK